jgi:hypothetical protein
MSDTAYSYKALEHAPRTMDQIEKAVREMAAAGHSDHTIAQVLHLDVNAVRQLIGPQ